MEPIIINAIRYAAADFIFPDLYKLADFEGNRTTEAGKAFEDLLKTLEGIDKVRLADLVVDISAEHLDVGFQNGFRLGVRLMLECLTK